MEIKDYIEKYQLVEKREAMFLLIWGLMSIMASAALYFISNDLFWKFFAYPFAGLGLGMVVEVISHFVNRKHKKVIFDDTILAAEKDRANAQIKNLDLRRNIDTILFIVGFALLILGGVITTQIISAGIGLGLLLQSTVLLVKDSWALWRARLYVVELEGEF